MAAPFLSNDVWLIVFDWLSEMDIIEARSFRGLSHGLNFAFISVIPVCKEWKEMTERYLYRRELHFLHLSQLSRVAHTLITNGAMAEKVSRWTRTITVASKTTHPQYENPLHFGLTYAVSLCKFELAPDRNAIALGLVGTLPRGTLRSLSIAIYLDEVAACELLDQIRVFAGLVSLALKTSSRSRSSYRPRDVVLSLRPWMFPDLRSFSWELISYDYDIDVAAHAGFMSRMRFSRLRNLELKIYGGDQGNATAESLAKFLGYHLNLDRAVMIVDDNLLRRLLPHLQVASVELSQPPEDVVRFLSPTVRHMDIYMENAVDHILAMLTDLGAALEHRNHRFGHISTCNVRSMAFMFSVCPSARAQSWTTWDMIEDLRPQLCSQTAYLRGLGV